MRVVSHSDGVFFLQGSIPIFCPGQNEWEIKGKSEEMLHSCGCVSELVLLSSNIFLEGGGWGGEGCMILNVPKAMG